MLEALTRQTAPVEGVMLHIPDTMRRTGAAYDIPAWLNRFPLLHINRCDDFGPATKLLGALGLERDPEAYIIVVDDDTLYPPCMVEAYRNCDLSGRDTVFCTAGFNIVDPLSCCDDVTGKLLPVRGNLVPVQVVEGYGSILYRRGLLGDDVLGIFGLPEYVIYSDDLYFSNYLARRRVSRQTIAVRGFGGDGFWKDRVMSYGRQGDALHLHQAVGSNRRRYAQTIRYFLETGNYWLSAQGDTLTDSAGQGRM